MKRRLVTHSYWVNVTHVIGPTVPCTVPLFCFFIISTSCGNRNGTNRPLRRRCMSSSDTTFLFCRYPYPAGSGHLHATYWCKRTIQMSTVIFTTATMWCHNVKYRTQ